ncbi:MAG TPA: SMI1/KNR4 family protein [Mucilaginibacter sp.]|jgi:hypothetical protein
MEFSNNFEKNDKPSDVDFQAFMNKIDFPIDNDYLDFIKNHDGAEGLLDGGIYIMLWRIKDLIEINRSDEDLPEWDNYFFIGSDGSDLRYAFDKRDGSIRFIDLYQLGEVEPENFGTSFNLFLEVLSKKPAL